MSTFALLTDLTTDSPLNVNFSPERCVRRRLNRSECAECLNVCPSEALSLIDNQVCHDLRQCTSCMMCTALCPNDAFVVNGYHLETRIQTLAPEEDLYVSCSRETQIHPDELVVPCVGVLSMAHLLALCLKPAGKIVFNVSACESCENKAAADHLESQVNLLKENHPDIIEAELIALKTATEPISALVFENRRSFLMEMKNGHHLPEHEQSVKNIYFTSVVGTIEEEVSEGHEYKPTEQGSMWTDPFSGEEER